MSQRSGLIVDIRDGIAAIRVERASACSSCGTRSVCGAGRADETVVFLPLDMSSAPARSGDRVTVQLAAGGLTRAAFLAYLLPAMSTLLGALLLAGAGDLAAVAGALAGLGLGLIALRRFSRTCASPAVLPAPTFLKPFGET